MKGPLGMGEERRFKVGDLVEAKHWDRDGAITDGVIAQVFEPKGSNRSSYEYAYLVKHACNPQSGDFFIETDVKQRSADDAWRAGHFFLDDIVQADDGITSFEGVIEKFVADGDRPYKVHDPVTKQTGFFGDAHLTGKYLNRDRPRERFQAGDWVVADDGEVRFEDAVIGRDPSPGQARVLSGQIIFGPRSGCHFVYAADGSGDVREYSEEHLRPRSTPVFPEFRDPEGRDPDWKWVHGAPARALSKAFQESRRQSAEAEAEVLPKDSSLFKHLNHEAPKRPIVSGFRGVLMWIAAIPVVIFAVEVLAPGAGQVVSLILVISSLGVVPWIAQRVNP